MIIITRDRCLRVRPLPVLSDQATSHNEPVRQLTTSLKIGDLNKIDDEGDVREHGHDRGT